MGFQAVLVKRLASALIVLATCNSGRIYAQDAGRHAGKIASLLESAKLGNAEAEFELGEAYREGDGVSQDPTEAVLWYKRAADQDFADAQLKLGLMYVKGSGVPKNSNEGYKWVNKAAEQDLAAAQYVMGLFFYKGEDIPKDYPQAFLWFSKAADQGYSYAESKLGLMYLHGAGVEKDTVKAYMWLNLCSSSSQDVRELRDSIEKQMTPAQIAEAQRLAREWISNHPALGKQLANP